MKQSLDGSLPKMCPTVRPFDQDGPHSRTQLNIGPYGKFTKKSSCLEPVAQLEPNFDKIVIGWSSSKIVSGSHTLPPRWPPHVQCSCIVIESSFDPGERLQAPGSLWFHQIFKILIVFVLYFKIYKRKMLSLNSKHVQYVKIYLPCNVEVNLITHLGVIALFSSNL